MLSIFSALLFATATVVSIWAMWVTIAPRLPYMRMLLRGFDPATVPALPRARSRGGLRAAPRRSARVYRAAA